MRSNEFDLAILAGGLGTRLRPVVSDVPKPMAPVGGVPFLEILINYWLQLIAPSKIVMLTGYKHAVVEAYFGSCYNTIPIVYIVENSPLGTGGALGSLAEVDDHEKSWIVLNGDTWWEAPLEFLDQKYKSVEMLMGLARVENGRRFGCVELSAEGIVKGMSTSFGSTQLINAGCYRIRNNILPSIKRLVDKTQHPCSWENDILPKCIARNDMSVRGVISSGSFIDIGIPNDYERAVQVLNKIKMWEF